MDKRVRLLWWSTLGILLIIACLKFLLPVRSPVKMEQAQANREIVVYITGAVNHPGLLHLPLDARLEDALVKADLRIDADREALNPAQKLKDGQKIIVPCKKVTPDIPETTVAAGLTPTPSTSPAKDEGSYNARININTAGVNQLDTIPGIGPSLAQRIIEYRTQNGLFSSPDEIQNVSGIGAKTYQKMADYITVGP